MFRIYCSKVIANVNNFSSSLSSLFTNKTALVILLIIIILIILFIIYLLSNNKKITDNYVKTFSKEELVKNYGFYIHQQFLIQNSEINKIILENLSKKESNELLEYEKLMDYILRNYNKMDKIITIIKKSKHFN